MHFDNPIVILIVVVALLLRWLSRKSGAADEEPTRPNVPNQPIPRSDQSQTEEDRIRRFLEALGQPTSSQPPPKIKPKRQRQIQPRPFPRPTLPPLTTAPFPEPSAPASATMEMPPPLPPERLLTPTTRPEPTYEVQDIATQTSKKGALPPGQPAAASSKGLILRFDSAQDLRNAIVLREILGPPRGLQPVERLS